MIDTTFLNQQRSKREQIVQEGRAAELREQDGFTNEALIKGAKEALGIGEDDLITAEFSDIMIKQNQEVGVLISLGSALNSAKGSGALSAVVMENIEDAIQLLAIKVAGTYGVDKDDLFEEE
jgi:hypothetical protein|tara:strand:- start:108 stop:473 length:366 start_codon:yes stop_codon:yes gene_type:complete